MNNKVYFTVLLSLFPTVVFSSPVITGIVGTLNIGQSVTINGSNFGLNGPNVLIFDEFSGIPGQTISLTATKGAWTVNDSPAYVADVGTNTAALLIDGVNSRQMELSFPNVQEIFISYKVKIPPGGHFPNTTTNGQFAPDSAWKMCWIMDGQYGYTGDDDITLPSWPNGTYFQITGNDTGIRRNGAVAWVEVGRPGYSTNWFSFKGWNRITAYLKAGADPVNDVGTIWFQGLSAEYGNKVFYYNDLTLFDGDDEARDNAISQWSYLTISGWHRTGGVNSSYDSGTRAIYDDVYVATGASAAARVEIGNEPIYKDCSKLAIATPDKWTDKSIIANIRSGEFAKGDSVYIFVIDGENNPSLGYGPIILSAPMIKKLQ
jgi:hypothetical protein